MFDTESVRQGNCSTISGIVRLGFVGQLSASLFKRCKLLQRLRPSSAVTMSQTASLLSGCNTIGGRRIKEKCKEERIDRI